MIDLTNKLLIAVVTAIFTLLIAYLIRKKKILEYDVFSMPLLRFTPKKERTLSVMVDKFLLTGAEADKGQHAPITNAYGFEVGAHTEVETTTKEVTKLPALVIIGLVVFVWYQPCSSCFPTLEVNHVARKSTALGKL